MAEYVVEIVTGEVRRLWCDRCHTSAAVEFDVHVRQPGQPEPGPAVGTLTGCLRCDPTWSGRG